MQQDVECPYCMKDSIIIKYGRRFSGGVIVQRFKCLTCGRYFMSKEKTDKKDLDLALEEAMKQKL